MSGHQLSRVRETHEQLGLRSPTALLVWQHIAAAWLRFAGDHWAVTAANGQPDAEATRALMLAAYGPCVNGSMPNLSLSSAEPRY